MNCQSQLVRLFLSSSCYDEFKTADKVECIGFLLRAVKGLYSESLVIVVQFYQITAEISSGVKNEMNCDSEPGSLLLSQTKIIKLQPRVLYYFRSLHYWLAQKLNCCQQRRLSRLTRGQV